MAEVTASIVSSRRIRHLQAITAPLLSMCLLMLTAKMLSSERLCVVSGMNARISLRVGFAGANPLLVRPILHDFALKRTRSSGRKRQSELRVLLSCKSVLN